MQPEITVFPIADALCASLETMAFICPMPPEPDATTNCPPAARRITIAFTGPTCATIELLAPQALGAVLASNLLACDPADAEALTNADDILKELANVTCGALITAIGGDQTSGYDMGIPQLTPIDASEWAIRLAASDATLLDAEGHLILASVR